MVGISHAVGGFDIVFRMYHLTSKVLVLENKLSFVPQQALSGSAAQKVKSLIHDLSLDCCEPLES